MCKIGCDCQRNQVDRAITSYTHIMCQEAQKNEIRRYLFRIIQLLVTVCKKLKNHYAQNKLPGNY